MGRESLEEEEDVGSARHAAWRRFGLVAISQGANAQTCDTFPVDRQMEITPAMITENIVVYIRSVVIFSDIWPG